MRHKTSQRDGQVNTGNGGGEVGSQCSWKNTIPVRGRGSVATVCSGGAGPKPNMSDDSGGWHPKTKTEIFIAQVARRI